MTTSAPETRTALATAVELGDELLTITLSDGRTISAPLAWYPRLRHATVEERGNWQFTGSGRGIHWPLIDEDICVAHVLAGFPSAESQASLKKWLAIRPVAK